MCSRKWVFRIGTLLLAGILVLTGAFAAREQGTGRPEAVWSAVSPANGLLEANSNRQVHPFSGGKAVSPFTVEGFEKIGETGELAIYLNRGEAALRVVNKNSGYVWGSLPVGEAEGLNSTWRCYGNGLVSIECFNEKGVESRVSIGKNGRAEYEFFDGGLLCKASFDEVGVAFQVKVAWDKDSLTMELVDGTLAEGIDGSTYTLKSMTFMPFLGSSYSDTIDGYMLIPDGSGALIRYRQPANYSSTYSARIFGKDYGLASLASTADNNARAEAQVFVPVYGMVHGAYQNAYLAVVESGAEYASILATPAQTNNPYNWAAARFEFRQKYVKNINRKEGAGTTIPQETANVVSPKISFHFSEGDEANYDGMAVMYRQLLIGQGVLSPLSGKDGAVPLQLELLGADKKNNFLWNTTSVFTTAQQAGDIVNALAGSGIGGLDVVYRCYTRNNECGTGFLPALGGPDDFKRLQQTVEALGGSLYYYLDPVTANEDQITLRTEAANNLSRTEIKWIEPTASTLYPYTYLYRLTEAEKRIDRAMEQNYGGEFALAQMSSKLYGDFTSGRELPRGAGMERVLAAVDRMAGGKKMAMYSPNQYLWQYVDKAYDLPVVNSQMLYESDCVPFLQIVLSGCVEMYGGAINTSSYSTERLLRQIEYGMAPSFAVTGCESIELYNTAQSAYFSTYYMDWQPQIEEGYRTVSQGLSAVWGHSIVTHRCVQTGLIRVGYDNGVSIYLNYTDKPLTADGVTVDAGGFVVTGGGEG